MKKLSIDEVLKRFVAVHGDRYDYSIITEETYVDTNTKVPVICKEHGVFYVTPQKHIFRKHGCPVCKGIKCSEATKNIPHTFCRTTKFGVGINDYDGCVNTDGKIIHSYIAWSQMLTRCYSKSYLKKQPTYIGCSVCEEWKTFSNFKKWFDENYVEGYSLDKDILFKGNKVYSPETCCFVPNEINALLIKHDGKRGKYPIGVSKHHHKFSARVNMYSTNVHLGYFNTPKEAFEAYKKAKEDYLKEIATKYFEERKITENVYKALQNYKVEITD